MDSNNLTDEQLVVKIREEDQELYGEIISRYKRKLSHYLRKFVRNPDELEDVTQVVFIKVYRNLYDFNVSRKFSSWIYRIAHNEAVNYLKKHGGKKISLDDMEYKIIDEKIDLDRDADQTLLRREIEKCLATLKPKYREPIILFYFEQKSYGEISDILRVPKSTVGTLISRGKEIIRQCLEEKT